MRDSPWRRSVQLDQDASADVAQCDGGLSIRPRRRGETSLMMALFPDAWTFPVSDEKWYVSSPRSVSRIGAGANRILEHLRIALR